MAIEQNVYNLDSITDYQSSVDHQGGVHAIEHNFGDDNITLIAKDAAILFQYEDENTHQTIQTPLQESKLYVLDLEYKYYNPNSSASVSDVELILTDDNETSEMSIALGGAAQSGVSRRLKIIFSPNRDNFYTRAVLKTTKRNSINDFNTRDTSRYVGTYLESSKMYELKNLLGSSTSIIKKLGIQGYEGLSFSINKEDLQIGKSGYYFIEDANINFIAIYVPEEDKENPPYVNSNRKFIIINYEY